MNTVDSAGYFTWLQFLLDKSEEDLERLIGYAKGSLSEGWKLLSPKSPLQPNNIDLRGSTRWSDGKLPDGRPIGSIIGARTDLTQAQKKIVSFFDQGLERRPAKVLSNKTPKDYPPATPHGIPQFKLFNPVPWVAIATVAPGRRLKKSDIQI